MDKTQTCCTLGVQEAQGTKHSCLLNARRLTTPSIRWSTRIHQVRPRSDFNNATSARGNINVYRQLTPLVQALGVLSQDCYGQLETCA